ncbi:uncharacterized protein LOC107041681 isoform X2 [Diachasma alloeum]|uniref:uncharacterized protein LOC107041681 isoform X2 n=1 Tax=Diachasma alloeum TaxID=454923 RepID=UPI0007382344|nr:uncharacterized protein LOC107041681 isoform X2 [Diachasma alloeum]XP_015117821.1 uncharacterized protein LOC107041681 isoform X2 [Diachasma alloeum]
MLPQTINDDLSLFFCQMYAPLISSWREDFNNAVNNDHQKHLEAVAEIFLVMNHTVWDHIGCTDAKKTLELQVCNQESIDYETWAKLCEFCSIEYMRDFANRVDWSESRFDSTITIFWYKKIYGSYPTESMFASRQDFLNFQNQLVAQIYEGYDINRILFKDSVSSDSLSAVKYFWNKLTDVQQLELSSEGSFFKTQSISTAVYLLSAIDFNYLPGNTMDCGPWSYLLVWPWVMFIDSWIHHFQIMDRCHFATIFRTLVVQRRKDQSTVIEEFTRRQIRSHLYAKYYVPCEKLWRLYCEKFGTMDGIADKISGLMFGSEDIQLCKIIMAGSPGDWRRQCLVAIGEYCKILSSQYSLSVLPNQDFRDKFMAVVLVNNEERQRFREIMHEVYNQ